MKKLFVLSFFTIIYTINLTTTAEIRFVSKTGSSTPPYTSWATAADSIQKCINICNDGDTVVVANGVYKETLLIETEITLLGSSMDSCIIDGTDLDGVPLYGNTGITIRTEKFLTIENFHLKGRRWEPMTLVLNIRNHGGNCKNLIIENARSGITFDGDNSRAENCFFYNISNAISTASDANVDTFYINNNLILNNKNDGSGISNIGGGIHLINNNILLCLSSSSFSGINFFHDYYSEVKNNLIANYRSNNYNGGHFIKQAIIENNIFLQNNGLDGTKDNIAIPKGNGTTIRNNIIAYAKRYGIDAVNDSVFADYNIFWENTFNTNSRVKLGENNVFADPMFVNDTIPNSTSNYDFHLQAYSPAIDAGDPNILDKDGSRSDIGMYGGLMGEVYSYMDLPPRVPTNINYFVISDSQKISFNWNMNSESDFKNYIVYRDTIQGFIISDNNKLLEIDTSYFTTSYSNDISKYYYRITAIDSQFNESFPSEEISVVITDFDEPTITIVKEYNLYQNYPNPFNPSTKIGYSLKKPGYVKLVLYDIKGEAIETLVNDYQSAGLHEIEFRAEGLSSGIYLYKIEIIGEDRIPKYTELKKLILLK
jgi:hypothetical protein